MYKVITNYIKPSKFTRPQAPLNEVKAIVIHWIANPNTTALQNRNYFNTSTVYGSAHEIIDLNGDLMLCVPENEITYNCGSETYTQRCLDELGEYPNNCTYSIECTHVDWTGKMTSQTYTTLLQRCIDLCKKFNLTAENLWLHKEVVGWKDCHRWFVNNPDEWIRFKGMVNMGLEKPWQQIEGEKALDSLGNKGIVKEVDKWKSKDLTESAPLWLMFLLIDRIS